MTLMTSGLLHVGDVIKEINGQEVLTPEHLQELIKKYSGTITFKIIPTSQDQNSSMKVCAASFYSFNSICVLEKTYVSSINSKQ